MNTPLEALTLKQELVVANETIDAQRKDIQALTQTANDLMAAITEHNAQLDEACEQLRLTETCADGSPLEPCPACPLRYAVELPK
jgi:hypothetical protein